MDNKQTIEIKIKLLGGTKENPRCESALDHPADPSHLTRFETIYEGKIPDIFKFFYEKYGPFAFNNDVVIKCLAKNPIAGDDNLVSVYYFCSFEQGRECAIDSILSVYPELLRQKLLPICEGEPGDLICMALNSGMNDNIFYWCHEESENENLYLVAENFMDFVIRIEIQEDVPDERAAKALLTASPKLLEMLKKSGYGPKQK
jgi:hypothetical protein